MDERINGQEPTLSNYQLRLPAYEGPLDVLLRLIERSQLAIEDVSLVAVTGQFLQFVAAMDDAPPAAIANFAAVGARLTVLKSRSLLPRPAPDPEEPEQSDLTHQLREYKRIKDLALHLAGVHAEGRPAHGAALNGAISRPGPGRVSRLVQHDARQLVRALRRRLTIIPRPAELIRQRRVVSLREVVERVAHMVESMRSVQFSQVVESYRTRTEVATAFLAVLVLIRRGDVDAAQGDLFSDIALGPGVAPDSIAATSGNEFIN
jgi:segregation and condensation protein A